MLQIADNNGWCATSRLVQMDDLMCRRDFRCNASAATACTKQRSTRTVNTNLRGYRKPHAALVFVIEGHTFLLEHVKTVVEEAGGGMDDIVKVTVFIRDMRLYDEIHEVRRRYFEEPYPASSMVEVSALIDPRLLIEIEAVAVVG